MTENHEKKLCSQLRLFSWIQPWSICIDYQIKVTLFRRLHVKFRHINIWLLKNTWLESTHEKDIHIDHSKKWMDVSVFNELIHATSFSRSNFHSNCWKFHSFVSWCDKKIRKRRNKLINGRRESNICEFLTYMLLHGRQLSNSITLITLLYALFHLRY